MATSSSIEVSAFKKLLASFGLLPIQIKEIAVTAMSIQTDKGAIQTETRRPLIRVEILAESSRLDFQQSS